MGRLTGRIIDKATGEPVEARVQVIGPNGNFAHPSDALLKVGTGAPFFYSDGTFDLDVGRGKTKIVAERGTEYVPAEITVDSPLQGAVAVDLELQRWNVLGEQGWHPGNTHIHYDEKEQRPDDRLSLDPRVEDLRMTAISILKRWELEYASNKYAPGFLNEFSSTHYYVQCGEENRHNALASHSIGYGHIMLLNIRNVVHPVSRGLLVDAFDPDYPPLSYACDDTHRQGGIVIWCHNGQGMEAPVAAALGKLDAFNLFDPFWMDPEYELWYRLLNCGIRLPASTGTDWFVCSNNRVYVQTSEEFSYGAWIEGMKAGRTYITNGPAIDMKVNGEAIGSTVACSRGGRVEVEVPFRSCYPVDSVEILVNGSVVERCEFPGGAREGSVRGEAAVEADGWVAARLWGNSRDSFDQSIYAHTSPTYLECGRFQLEREADARFFIDGLDRSLSWVDTVGRYNDDRQREDVKELFRRGREAFETLSRP